MSTICRLLKKPPPEPQVYPNAIDARAGAFKAPPGREAVLWDGVVPGLGVRALPTSGRKTWIVHRRVGSAVAKRTLAAPDAISVEEARRAVQALIEEVEGDAGAPASVPTIRAFGPSFLADCAGRWKPTTRAAHAHNMQRSILPAFGICRVDTITARDVRSWFDDLSVTREETANRSPAVLSSLMKHAEARKAEALGLRWEYVHGDRIVLPDSKSGPRTVWLATPARAVLGALPRRDGCPWVFASDDATPVSLVKPWQVIRRKAGLGRLRHHDLRHSYAAVAADDGEGLRIVAGLLDHTDIETTFGYAHLTEASVFKAADRVSRTLAEALDGKGADHG